MNSFTEKYKYFNVFFVQIVIMVVCISQVNALNDTREKLYDLRDTIKLAKDQQEEIDDKLVMLDTQIREIQKNITDNIYTLTRLYHSFLSLKKSGAQYGYLVPKTSYHDYYYRLRHLEILQDIIKDQLYETTLQNITLQNKISEINQHTENRMTLILAVENKIKQIEVMQTQKDIDLDISDFVKETEKKALSLDDFLENTLDISSKDISMPTPMSDYLLPVSGIVRQSSPPHDKGLSIEAISGALVISPQKSIVIYAGEFKKLGRIVILNHTDGYISVLKGLDKIFVSVGHHVEQGEPIATLPVKNNKDNKNTSVLYYELRYNNKIVNPFEKMSGL